MNPKLNLNQIMSDVASPMSMQNTGNGMLDSFKLAEDINMQEQKNNLGPRFHSRGSPRDAKGSIQNGRTDETLHLASKGGHKKGITFRMGKKGTLGPKQVTNEQLESMVDMKVTVISEGNQSFRGNGLAVEVGVGGDS